MISIIKLTYIVILALVRSIQKHGPRGPGGVDEKFRILGKISKWFKTNEAYVKYIRRDICCMISIIKLTYIVIYALVRSIQKHGPRGPGGVDEKFHIGENISKWFKTNEAYVTYIYDAICCMKSIN